MDDHGYDQAACRRAAELLREEAERMFYDAANAPTDAASEGIGRQMSAFQFVAKWLEEQR